MYETFSLLPVKPDYVRKPKRQIFLCHDRVASKNRNLAAQTSTTPIVPRDVYKNIRESVKKRKTSPIHLDSVKVTEESHDSQQLRGSSLLCIRKNEHSETKPKKLSITEIKLPKIDKPKVQHKRRYTMDQVIYPEVIYESVETVAKHEPEIECKQS